jgi:hypothetical protein
VKRVSIISSICELNMCLFYDLKVFVEMLLYVVSFRFLIKLGTILGIVLQRMQKVP